MVSKDTSTPEKAEDGEKEVQLTAEQKKILKELEATGGEGKIEREEIKLEGLKYKWFIDHKYDIDPVKGLVWKDYDQISKQRKAAFQLVKDIGANILKGRSIMNVSMPITLMEPQTMLHRVACTYGYLPIYAEKIVKESDPIEKMKNYLAYSIAALYGNLQQMKPLNPVWGETYQGYLGNSCNKIYCEQISHHPPMTQITIESPLFTVNATHHIEAATYPSSIRIYSKGKHVVTFNDEQKTTYVLKERPEGQISGVIVGQRIMYYTGFMVIKDKTNKLYAQVRFNPEKQGMLEKIFGKTKATRSDFFKGLITKSKDLLKDTSRKAFYSKEMLSYFEGEWLEHIIIDGDYYWELGKKTPMEIFPDPGALPSDSAFRADIQPLAKGDMETAQKEKENLENLQRNDRKLRAEFKKAAKKK
eukprot:TRINITY_DN7387_c0_g1_i18.p1 TRINITY_DN7387_c0_g1~~TRINITY_DN7387_c0_g1_i18.p1  ORF type:complete len:417 (+),score=165.92 TRINITY_DN7387_c0_g1_i18:109-1359(+)